VRPIEGATSGAVEPVAIRDPASPYGRARIEAGVHYLQRAPLSVKGEGGRNTMFAVCCVLVRRLRLPMDVAADLIEAIYNPRLEAVGTSSWSREQPGPHRMTIIERLHKARHTGTIPPGDVPDEETWNILNRIGVAS